jgi:hypothetical protein
LSNAIVRSASKDGPGQIIPAQAIVVAVATFRALLHNLTSFQLSLAQSGVCAPAMEFQAAWLLCPLIVHLKHVVRLNVANRCPYLCECRRCITNELWLRLTVSPSYILPESFRFLRNRSKASGPILYCLGAAAFATASSTMKIRGSALFSFSSKTWPLDLCF